MCVCGAFVRQICDNTLAFNKLSVSVHALVSQ